MKEETRVALVTGANRGIGLEVCRALAERGFRVFLGSRDVAKGRAAAVKAGAGVESLALDVADPASIERAIGALGERAAGRLDVLINNAGILLENGWSALEIDAALVERAFATNALGPFRLCQAVIPLMRKRGYGRIVNVSSEMGQLADMGGGYAAYRMSKVALNAVTRIFAAEVLGTGILVNSVSPGWVRTDMGGASAPRTVEQGADTIIWAATLPAGGPTGGFFANRERIGW